VTSGWESVMGGGGRALSAMVHRSRPLPSFRLLSHRQVSTMKNIVRYVGVGNFMA
jgi:hypothetical protein